MSAPTCFFAGRPGAGGCDGRLERAHWIKQQVLRRELGALFVACPRCGAGLDEPCTDLQRGVPLRSQSHKERNLATQALVWDPRVWSWMCHRHHARLDFVRSLTVARGDLPPGLEVFAAEVGLAWWLSREYGERAEAA